jgi:hypothetical protein
VSSAEKKATQCTHRPVIGSPIHALPKDGWMRWPPPNPNMLGLTELTDEEEAELLPRASPAS